MLYRKHQNLGLWMKLKHLMHIIEILIHQFLAKVARGQALIDPSLYQKFSQDADVLLQRQFAREPREFTLRMSNLGRPSCQLEYEAMGIPGDHVAADIVRNLYGDLTERIMMFILHASGVPIIEEQKSVNLHIANTNISGTLDIVVNFDTPKVWDIKSASEWTFKNKLNKSFEEIYAEDTFGYIPQLFLYGEAYGCKVGGLIVFNKSSSEIRVIEAPTNQRLLRKRALREVEDKINFLAGKGYSKAATTADTILGNNTSSHNASAAMGDTTSPTISTAASSSTIDEPAVSKCFQSAPEYFRSKPTGNQVAAFTCTMCPWRFKCWPSLVLKPKAQSTAKEPSLVYYTEYHD